MVYILEQAWLILLYIIVVVTLFPLMGQANDMQLIIQTSILLWPMVFVIIV